MFHLQWTYAVVWFLLFFQSKAQLLALFQSLPPCAQQCFYTDYAQITGSGCSDIQCFCNDTGLITLVENCLQQCPASDQQQTYQALHPYCPSIPNPLGATSSSISTVPTRAVTTSPTSTVPTIAASTSSTYTAPTAAATSSTSIAPSIAAITSSKFITATIVTTPTVSTTPTVNSKPTTSALPVFTGAAKLPAANLALVGMGLLGAFHGLL